MSVGIKRHNCHRTLYELSIKHNILIPILIFIIALFFKILDVFVWRLDEALGEIIVSKSIGFLLIIAYLWFVGKSISAIGLHGYKIRESLVIGGIGGVLIILIIYVAQFGALIGTDKQPSLVFTAIDPKAGVTGGAAFALFMVVGNFINSFMEDGLFRGVMLTHFRVSLSFWKANFLQAAFFGIWHLNWPVKQFTTGEVDLSGFISQAVIVLVATAIMGFAMGYLYLKTANLWAPWLMHTIVNTVQNIAHIQTVDGLDSDIMVFQVTLTICLIAILPLIRFMARRFQTPELEPWSQTFERHP